MKPYLLFRCVAGGICIFLAAGCLRVESLEEAALPVHDEKLDYALPYDLTFLRVLEAVDNVDGWGPEETEMMTGKITVRNMQYGSAVDADNRRVTLRIERLEPEKTRISLIPESQRTLGGDKILAKVKEFLDREIVPQDETGTESQTPEP